MGVGKISFWLNALGGTKRASDAVGMKGERVTRVYKANRRVSRSVMSFTVCRDARDEVDNIRFVYSLTPMELMMSRTLAHYLSIA